MTRSILLLFVTLCAFVCDINHAYGALPQNTIQIERHITVSIADRIPCNDNLPVRDFGRFIIRSTAWQYGCFPEKVSKNINFLLEEDHSFTHPFWQGVSDL